MDSWLNLLCCFYAEKYRIVHGAQKNMEQREDSHCQERGAPRQKGVMVQTQLVSAQAGDQPKS